MPRALRLAAACLSARVAPFRAVLAVAGPPRSCSRAGVAGRFRRAGRAEARVPRARGPNAAGGG
eukprot:5467202-Lingulodinium_polyedra.AAC.1